MKLLILLAAALMFLGCTAQNTIEETEDSMTETTVEDTGDSMVDEKAGDQMQETGDSMEETGESMTDETTMELGGSYVPFEKSAYLQAREDGKKIFLEFYANWCPSCAQQEPEIESAFAKITDPEIVGFRVNYKDSDTDQDEVDLAREFGITYQHTHVLINSEGDVVIKSQEFWSESQVLDKVNTIG